LQIENHSCVAGCLALFVLLGYLWAIFSCHKQVLIFKFITEIGKNKGKKNKRVFLKIFMLSQIVKSKIEMILKVLSFHLQVKFFAIAFVGLLINVARFWMDIKKSYPPQKVLFPAKSYFE
jgi:hypothetical protein